jgi:hypothetical protein
MWRQQQAEQEEREHLAQSMRESTLSNEAESQEESDPRWRYSSPPHYGPWLRWLYLVPPWLLRVCTIGAIIGAIYLLSLLGEITR